MTTTIEENAAETIDCQIEILSSSIRDLRDQIDAEAGKIGWLKQRVVSCQEAIERHKQIVAECDKRLDETALDLGREAVDAEDALSWARTLDAKRSDNRLLLELYDRALPALEDLFKQVAVSKPLTKSPIERLREKIEPLGERLRCWQLLKQHLEEGSDQSEHDFLRQCGLVSLSTKEIEQFDNLLRAVNRVIGRFADWSYRLVKKNPVL